MKRNILMSLLAVLSLTASAGIKTEIKISGELGEPLPTFLYHFQSRQSLAEGKADGGFVTFTLETEEPVIAMVGRSADGRQPVCPVIIDGSPIELKLKGSDVDYAKGSEQNIMLGEASQRLAPYQGQMGDIMKEYSELYQQNNGKVPADKMADIQKRYEEVQQDMIATQKQLILENTENLVPIYYLRSGVNDYGFEFVDSYLKTYKHAANPMLDPVHRMLAGERNKVAGAPVVDFVGQDLQGKECHLTDYVGKGKYVLVDFWASWCGPCRGEMPNVKAAYEKYHEKGFEIVGISFDNKLEAWQKGVEDLGIVWPQISDINGWDCAASDIFNIKSIPATILYGPDGKVIKTGLRGEELAKTLEEIFK